VTASPPFHTKTISTDFLLPSVRLASAPSRWRIDTTWNSAAKGSVKKAAEGFMVEAEMEGAGARELNRTLLSALRKVQRKTTLRAEWTSGDGITEKSFDYVLKKTTKN
jgi:hypothetical protein